MVYMTNMAVVLLDQDGHHAHELKSFIPENNVDELEIWYAASSTFKYCKVCINYDSVLILTFLEQVQFCFFHLNYGQMS